MLLVCFVACNSDCQTFTDEVPTELPPNLAKQLDGLLNNNKWVLANDNEHTIIIEAQGSYEDKIYNVQYGKSTECEKNYVGESTFKEQYGIRNSESFILRSKSFC